MAATAVKEQAYPVHPRWNGDGDVKELDISKGMKAVTSTTSGYGTVLVNGKTILYDKRELHCELKHAEGRFEHSSDTPYIRVAGIVVAQDGMTKFVKDLRRDEDTEAIGRAITKKESINTIVFGIHRKQDLI